MKKSFAQTIEGLGNQQTVTLLPGLTGTADQYLNRAVAQSAQRVKNHQHAVSILLQILKAGTDYKTVNKTKILFSSGARKIITALNLHVLCIPNPQLLENLDGSLYAVTCFLFPASAKKQFAKLLLQANAYDAASVLYSTAMGIGSAIAANPSESIQIDDYNRLVVLARELALIDAILTMLHLYPKWSLPAYQDIRAGLQQAQAGTAAQYQVNAPDTKLADLLSLPPLGDLF